MHPVEKYKRIAKELLAKAQQEESQTARRELQTLAECYALLAQKTERNSWRYVKAES